MRINAKIKRIGKVIKIGQNVVSILIILNALVVLLFCIKAQRVAKQNDFSEEEITYLQDKFAVYFGILFFLNFVLMFSLSLWLLRKVY